MARSNWMLVALGLLAAACSSNPGTSDGGGTSGTADAGRDAGLAAPLVRSISPATGPTDGGTAVRIAGTNFEVGAQVKLGSNALQSVVVVSSSEIDGVTPPAAAGQVDIVVLDPDSRIGSLRSGFTYVAPPSPPSVDWCNLQFPIDAGVPEYQSLTLYGRVYKAGVTDMPGQGPGVVMYGGIGLQDGGWVWYAAIYNTDVPSSPGANDINNDEYKFTTPPLSAGVYPTAFAARYGDAGIKYCEVDGIHDSLDLTQAGQLISFVPPPPTVSWCDLQFPTSTTGAPGSPVTLYGQVYVAGVTDRVGQGAGIQMQAGLGFTDGGWSWNATTYDGDRGPNGAPTANDEYRWDGTCPAAPGDYLTAFRASLDGGPWTYCLTDGPHDQLDSSKAGSLSVIPAAPPVVSWCNLQFPTEQRAAPDAGLTVFGRVYQPGVTDVAGQGPGISMQLGVDSGDAGWTWMDAAYNKDVSSFPSSGDINNDEYEASFNAPAIGNYAMAYRASLDGGPWTFCEVDGPHTTYAPLAAAPLTVGDTVSWCNLQYPQYPPDSQVDAGAAVSFYGRVYQPGITDQVGQGPGIEMQFGYGPGDGGWSWSAASFNGDKDGLTPGDHANDEYVSSIAAPAAGSYATLYRARLDGGPWLYCEPDGPHLGISIADAGVMVTQ